MFRSHLLQPGLGPALKQPCCFISATWLRGASLWVCGLESVAVRASAVRLSSFDLGLKRTWMYIGLLRCLTVSRSPVSRRPVFLESLLGFGVSSWVWNSWMTTMKHKNKSCGGARQRLLASCATDGVRAKAPPPSFCPAIGPSPTPNTYRGFLLCSCNEIS